MREIIEWLKKMEKLSGQLYIAAADYFKQDIQFHRFLKELAKDEKWHFKVLSDSAEYLEHHATAPSISIDENTKNEFKTIYSDIVGRIKTNSLTKEYFLDVVINAEYSEWNDLFLFAVNTLEKSQRDYKIIASKMQNHKRSIEYYFEKIPGGKDKIRELKNRPSLWNDRILIVDDEEPLALLMKAILKDEGNIDIAGNGAEALKKLRDNYYQLIISDVDMPVMNGIAFFEEAINIYPNIRSRFLFFSGNITRDRINYFTKNHILFMEKPAEITVIRDNALQVLLQNKSN